MAEQFYTILTNVGKAKVANATALGTLLNLAKFALGDGNGAYYSPSETQSTLKNEVWRGAISAIEVDENNPNWIVITAIIPSTEGGFTIREAGVIDEDGNLIAIGKYPETYKPIIDEGSSKDLYIKLILEVSNTSSVTLKVDPTVIIATKKDIQTLDERINTLNTNIDEELNNVNKEIGDILQLPTISKDNIVNSIKEISTNTTKKTTAAINYYVNVATGSDENDGLTSSTPFKTIGKAISLLPQVINHTLMINIANGIYNEDISINEFMGGGTLNLIGNVTSPTSVNVTSLSMLSNTLSIAISGINAITNTDITFNIRDCNDFVLDSVRTTSNNNNIGAFVKSSNGRITNSTFSNKTYGIVLDVNAQVYLYNNAGSNNTNYGIVAMRGSIASMDGTNTLGNISQTLVQNMGKIIKANEKTLLSSSGYKISGDGLIIQWGRAWYTDLAANGVSYRDITFPLAFPNNVFTVIPVDDSGSRGTSGPISVHLANSSGNGSSVALTKFTARIDNPGTSTWGGTYWIAIGN